MTPPNGAHGARWLSREYAELIAALPPPDSDALRLAADVDVLIVGSGYGGAMAAAELSGLAESAGSRAVSVWVLERGVEYLPGAFPARMEDLVRQVRGGAGDRRFGGEGLFDLRLGRDLNVVQANGLGGGSLINAGVMVRPRPGVFGADWPRALRKWSTRDRHYEAAKRRLGATQAPTAGAMRRPAADNHIGLHARYADGARPDKHVVLQRMAGAAGRRVTDAALTIAMRDKTTSGNVRLHACRLCGDCATGCNWGAKESLDTNQLALAAQRGARIYCGATALRVERRRLGDENLWALEVVHTDARLREREGGSRWIVARKLVLAAGALGSTEILLRSQQPRARGAGGAAAPLQFSAMLGRRFSGNGDMLTFGYDYAQKTNAFADEDQAPDQRQVGPTITGVWRDRAAEPSARPGGTTRRHRLTVEEMAVPGPLRRFAQEMLTTADTLHRLAAFDARRHEAGHPPAEPYAVQPDKIARTSVFAAMGDDGAAGTLTLAVDDDAAVPDGQVRVVWPALREAGLFEAQWRHARTLARRAGLGGRTLANPLWKPLPPGVDLLAPDARGALLTVHPLGGCAMADDVARGVVDALGEVYDPAGDDADARHEGLFVLDGAIVPTALGTNPALTIAMLALRAARAWRRRWKWTRVPRAPDAAPARPPPLERPVYANAAAPGARATLDDVHRDVMRRLRPAPTLAVFTERLSGVARLPSLGGDCRIEINLTYRPLDLRRLFEPAAQGRLQNAVLEAGGVVEEYGRRLPAGRLRVFDESRWRQIQCANLPDDARELALDRAALVALPLRGRLTVLRREPGGALARVVTRLWSWWCNRGYRDTIGAWLDRAHLERAATAPLRALIAAVHRLRDGRLPSASGVLRHLRERLRALRPASALRGLCRRIAGLGASLSHAGEVRLFEYRLQIGRRDWRRDAPPVPAALADLAGQVLSGRKRITYGRAGNPWRQLQELRLEQLGGWRWDRHAPVLALDPLYLATRETPLLRLESHANLVRAWADVASLGLLMLRMLASIHGLGLRKPDRPRLRQVERLPGRVEGMPEPQVHEIEVDRLGDRPVRMRLTRYRPAHRSPTGVPLLMLHGYSASGTTYVHPALRPGLARVMVERGIDVWIADLRSSAGMPTATHPWTFEQVALADIPAAVEFVCAHTGADQIDVFAHCMGAAMFSMGVLSAHLPLEPIVRPHPAPGLDRFAAARRLLPQRIRRVALSQIGPLMMMTPQNTFRAFVISFVAHALGPLRYAFRPEAHDAPAMTLFDRLLATLPYPDAELRRENHATPLVSDDYIGSRHRMDALYGHTFKLENLDAEVLDHLDDFFGPLSLGMLAQVAHFARTRTITNRIGRNVFVSAESLSRNWRFPTLSLHGAENGLADVATLHRVGDVLTRAGVPWSGVLIEGRGHQDCLIGKPPAGPSARAAAVGPPERVRHDTDLLRVAAEFFS